MLRCLTDSILPNDIVLADADLIRVLLASIATLKLPVWPDRIEPRAKKRRPKNLPLLMMPRQVVRQAIRIKRGLILGP